MRSPSTFQFLLRWYRGHVIFGLAFLGIAAWGFLRDVPAAPNPAVAAFSSPFADAAGIATWFALAFGVLLLVRGWMKASDLRNGRP